MVIVKNLDIKILFCFVYLKEAKQNQGLRKYLNKQIYKFQYIVLFSFNLLFPPFPFLAIFLELQRQYKCLTPCGPSY